MNRWILVTLVLVVGCKVSDPQAVKCPPPIAKPQAADAIAAALRRHKQLWVSQKVRNYQYTLTAHCRCAMHYTGPVEIVVRDAKIKSGQTLTGQRRSSRSGIPFDPKDFTNYASMDRIFQAIEGAIADKIRRIEVIYNPQLGYPTKVLLDPNIPDAQIELVITNFEVIPE